MAKATKKKALGRGLSALLQDPENDIKTAKDKGAEKVVGSVVELSIDAIAVNPHQPRTSFSKDALEELASSIKELGVIQPITVRKIDFNKYQVVSGERRYRASKMIGLKNIPAYIRIANDQETLEMALVENIQRQDLDPIEIALTYQRLLEEIDLTQERLSERVGKKRSTISNYLRLLKLDPIIQTGIRDGFLSMGHGRAIINIPDPNIQIEIYEKVITEKLSVRDTEKLVRYVQKHGTLKRAEETPSKKEIKLKSAIKDFSEHFGTKVDVKVNAKGRGKIVIPFSSEEDFRRLEKLIKVEK